MNKIGHQFTSDFVGLNIRLYHSSQQTAIATFTVDHTVGKSSQWTTLAADNILRYISDNYDAGGDFYLGYKQSDLEALGAEALRMDLNWQKAPCSCDRKWSDWYKQRSNFIDVIGFEIAETEMPGDVLFDPDDLSISHSKNFGLNLNLTTKCDIGYFIEQEEILFAESMNLYIGKTLLGAMAYSTRGSNQLANQVNVEAKKELFHSAGVWGTVFDRAQKSTKALSFDLSGLDESCLPCDDNEIILGVGTLS